MNTRGDKELGQRALTEQVFFWNSEHSGRVSCLKSQVVGAPFSHLQVHVELSGL